jgi:L-asparaginase/beta-aspartyl-peptidase (threonine type)
MEKVRIVTHGGTESEKEHADGCQVAARAGVMLMAEGGDALSAVVSAVSLLECDGRFNAGRGSLLGMDGKTMSCDAAVMDYNGKLGAVANLVEVEHPVQVARAVADTPPTTSWSARAPWSWHGA